MDSEERDKEMGGVFGEAWKRSGWSWKSDEDRTVKMRKCMWRRLRHRGESQRDVSGKVEV